MNKELTTAVSQWLFSLLDIRFLSTQKMFFIKILTILSISSSGRSAGMVMWISFIYIVQYTKDSKSFASKSLFVLIFLIQIHKKIFIQNEYKYVNMPLFFIICFHFRSTNKPEHSVGKSPSSWQGVPSVRGVQGEQHQQWRDEQRDGNV